LKETDGLSPEEQVRLDKYLANKKTKAKTLTSEQENHAFGADFAVFNSKKLSNKNG
jgi:hypothetical protein